MVYLTKQTLAIIVIVAVAIIIVIFIIHAMAVRKTKGNGGRVYVSGTFEITIGPKTLGNKFHDRGSPNCFYLNGVEAPTLKLSRNLYYEFRNKTDTPFYFTVDSKGGKGSPGSLNKKKSKDFIGLANGTIFFMTSNDLPDVFYYQAGNEHAEFMGSAILLE